MESAEKHGTPDEIAQRIVLKRYAHGKFHLYGYAPERHRAAVERALVRAAVVGVRFEKELFRTSLRKEGIDEATIEQYLATAEFTDDVYDLDRAAW